jgi:hypothetical protein
MPTLPKKMALAINTQNILKKNANQSKVEILNGATNK